MSDAERASLLATSGETSARAGEGSRWVGRRWRAVAAVGATALLIGVGAAVEGGRRERAALGDPVSSDIDREVIDARLKSVFGISLKNFAGLMRDQEEMSYADRELIENNKRYKALEKAEAEAEAKREAEAKAVAEANAKAEAREKYKEKVRAEAEARAEADADAEETKAMADADVEATFAASEKITDQAVAGTKPKSKDHRKEKLAAQTAASVKTSAAAKMRVARDEDSRNTLEAVVESARSSEEAQHKALEADTNAAREKLREKILTQDVALEVAPAPVRTEEDEENAEIDLEISLGAPTKTREREARRRDRRRRSHLGSIQEYDDDDEINNRSPPILPVFFHTEKSGGTSLALHTLELLSSDDPEALELINRVRTEDVMLDSELRRCAALCPGSAMFLSTVWQNGSVWIPGHPRPLEDQSAENWKKCRVLTSHTGRELLLRAEEAEEEIGVVRPKILMGLFRDPAEYEQAAWRSELFMYHELRAKLGWGKLAETPLGSALDPDDVHDFGRDSKFAKIMLNEHCSGLENNFQTRKLLEDDWWWVKDKRHEVLLEMARQRVMKLDWIGLTHRFDEGTCMLAYTMRRKPLATNSTNYDRGSLLPDTLRANHPHSGDHHEGEISPVLRNQLYKCNDLDTAVFNLAENEFNSRKQKMMDRLNELVRAEKELRPVRGAGNDQVLDPRVFLECMAAAAKSTSA